MEGLLVKYIDPKWVEEFLSGKILFRAIEAFRFPKRISDDVNPNIHGDWLGGVVFSDGQNRGIIDVLTLREKIFCSSVLEINPETGKYVCPDKRMCLFGESAIIILDPFLFLRKVLYSIYDKYGNDFWAAFHKVEYAVDLTYEQPYDEFAKSIKYSYQNEFRIALDLALGKFSPKTLEKVAYCAKATFLGPKIETDQKKDSIADELIIDIGDIRDICLVVSAEELAAGKVDLSEVQMSPISNFDFHIPREPYYTFWSFVQSLP